MESNTNGEINNFERLLTNAITLLQGGTTIQEVESIFTTCLTYSNHSNQLKDILVKYGWENGHFKSALDSSRILLSHELKKLISSSSLVEKPKPVQNNSTI